MCTTINGAAQSFSSGSDGTHGALNVTSNTVLTLPPDGIFHFTSINIPSGQTLSFTKNALNTPVYLLAQSNITVGGVIDVSGQSSNGRMAGVGGPGGFDGGFGPFQGASVGDGQGPGGGKWGGAVAGNGQGGIYATAISGNTNTYGNTLLSPLIGGSGGSGFGGGQSVGGGGGGGAILIASSTRVTISGRVDALGAPGCAAGSGGAIRIVAPVIDGSGTLRPLGGGNNCAGPSYYNGGDGRSRIDSIDRFAHRNLTLLGRGTRGSRMFVFPPGNPRLDIINAAGTPISEGTNVPASISLPVGSPTNQIVRVQARGFTEDVLISVKITPENAPSATFNALILQSSGTPPFADVQVTLPLDTVCYIHAWTR